MGEKFTPKAKARWETIPQWAKDKILKNVWCTNCRCSTTIIDFSGRMEKGDLILSGRCAKCGNEVARLIEGG